MFANKKSLYGLKQTPRYCNRKLDLLVTCYILVISYVNPCVYFEMLHRNTSITNLNLHVNDMLIVGQVAEMIHGLKNNDEVI